MEPSDSAANSTFTFDPTNKVIGVMDNVDDTRDALRDLIAVGLSEKEIALLTDEEAARRISENDEWSEISVHIFRSTQKLPAFYDAPVIVRRLEQELHAGHHLIGVIAKDGETRERACGILKSHGGHFINFYGRWAAEALEP
jgi:hypothetical protein